jgi:hypothetical protein
VENSLSSVDTTNHAKDTLKILPGLVSFRACVSLAGSLSLSPLAANAGVITLYDIGFSAPTHRVGVTPAYGSAINQVSSFPYPFSRPTVENTFGGVANQSLHFDAATNTSEGMHPNLVRCSCSRWDWSVSFRRELSPATARPNPKKKQKRGR